jgi:hypothetical protein
MLQIVIKHHVKHGNSTKKMGITNGKCIEGQWQHQQMAQDQATHT